MRGIIAAMAAVVTLSVFGAGASRADEGPAAADTTAAGSDSPQALFEEGNREYLQGAYQKAAELYARVLTDFEIEDPALYANLGNAYFRAGAYGSAIFFYRRGLRLNPDGAIADRLDHNLEVTRRALQQRYRSGSGSSSFIYDEPGGLMYKVTHLIPPGPLAGLFLAFWALLCVLLVARRLKPSLSGLGATATGAGVAAILFGMLLWGQVYTDRSFRLGVVITDGVVLREGRHADANGVDIPEGMEVRIVESDEDWARIELANGREGWVKAGNVKQI